MSGTLPNSESLSSCSPSMIACIMIEAISDILARDLAAFPSCERLDETDSGAGDIPKHINTSRAVFW